MYTMFLQFRIQKTGIINDRHIVRNVNISLNLVTSFPFTVFCPNRHFSDLPVVC